MFKMDFKSVCISTVMVSPEPVSPLYSIQFNLFNSIKSITKLRELLDTELVIIHYVRHSYIKKFISQNNNYNSSW